MSGKKTNLKKKITIPIILYIIIVISVTVYTFSWFVSNRRVEVGIDDEINITIDNKLEISNADLEERVWGNRIELNLTNDEIYPDITGNGIDFYYPTYLVDGDTPNMDDVGSYKKLTDADSSHYLLTLRILFRSTENISVYLGNQSTVSPKNTEYTGADARRSMFGDFSADYIAGCSRVAFLEVDDGVETLKNVWIPNDKYHLAYEEGTDSATFSSSGEREENYGYHTIDDGQVKEIHYTSEDIINGSLTIGSENLASAATQTAGPMVNGATPLLSFSGQALEEKELIIRIWFEGTDREADKAFNGGQVTYNFEFLGIIKDEATEADLQKIDSLECRQDGYLYFGDENEVASGFLYSVNAIDWQQYGGVGGIKFTSSDTKVYVKTLETSSSKSSRIYEKLINIEETEDEMA